MTTQHRKDYIARYNLARYHRRMEEAYEILGGSCVVCGSTKEMQIDHFDPSKKEFTLGKLWSVSEERFLEELSKCQLLCWQCHLVKTATFDKKAIMAKQGKVLKIGEKKSPRKRTGVLKQN